MVGVRGAEVGMARWRGGEVVIWAGERIACMVYGKVHWLCLLYQGTCWLVSLSQC